MQTILIVDDQKSALERFITLLSKEDDWLVIDAVRDGEAAINVINLKRPDIVFTDIVVPKIGGVEIIEYIRSIEGYNPIIYAISDMGGSVTKWRLDQLDVDCYSYKSIPDRDILRNLYMALNMQFVRPSYMDDDEYLEDCVNSLISQMGIPLYFLYSRYMADAIMIHIRSGEEMVITKTILPEVAKLRGISASAVDSGMRLFIKNASKKKSSMFIAVFGSHRRRLTSSTFIFEAASYIKRNMKSK